MRSAIITICAALVIMGFAIWGDITIRQRSEQLIQMCGEIINDGKNGDIHAASEHYSNMHDTWDKNEGVLSYFVCHSNLLDIQAAFVRLEYAIESGDIEYLKLATAILENEITDIPHLETIRLETVF